MCREETAHSLTQSARASSVTLVKIVIVICQIYSNLSQQEAQLPQRNSASAAHSCPSSPSGYMYAYSRIRKPQQTHVKRAVHKAHFKMNRAFKVIQGHPYWCRQESGTVCCRNVQLMPPLFVKLTKIWQGETGKFVDFNDLTQV